MKHFEGDYVLLSDIKDVDELNAVHDALVAGSGAIPSHKYPFTDLKSVSSQEAINLYDADRGLVRVSRCSLDSDCRRRLTVDQVLGRTPAYSYIVMDGTVEVSGPTSYEDACKDAREYAKANPEDTYTVCMVCRVFKGRVVVDESSYGEGES